jgi:hypothetical protein
MQDLLLQPVIYRLWRLRRLFLFSLALPAAALLALYLLTQGEAVLLGGPPLLALVIFGILLLAGVMLRYPAAAGEVIICSLTLSCLILLSVFAERLAAREAGPLDGSNILGLLLIILFAAACVFVGTAALVTLLSKLGPRPRLRWAVTHRTDLPAETAYGMLKPTPNTSEQWRRFGPADENGRFGAWITRADLLPKTVDAASDQGDRPHYVVEVNELSPLSCSIISALPDGRTEANILTVHPEGSGSRVEVKAVHNVFTWWEAFVIVYLADLMTDYTIATLDAARGRTPVRAIQLLPFDSLTLWVERRYGRTDGPPF